MGSRRPRGPAPSSVRTLLALGLVAGSIACAAPDPMRYRLAGSGTHWDVAGGDPVLDDLRPRYADFFDVILDPSHTEDPNLLVLRDDLERSPVDRRNFDALNALAIAYFEINYRGQTQRGRLGFISLGMRAAQLAAVPWRAYGDVADDALREGILDFYADAATGEKLGTASTGSRLSEIVASLAHKESDPGRLERIDAITRQLRELRPRP